MHSVSASTDDASHAQHMELAYGLLGAYHLPRKSELVPFILAQNDKLSE
jgi:hypothetical protein